MKFVGMDLILLLWKLAYKRVGGIPIGASVSRAESQFQVNFEQKQVSGQFTPRIEAMCVSGDRYTIDSSPLTGGTGIKGLGGGKGKYFIKFSGSSD